MSKVIRYFGSIVGGIIASGGYVMFVRHIIFHPNLAQGDKGFLLILVGSITIFAGNLIAGILDIDAGVV